MYTGNFFFFYYCHVYTNFFLSAKKRSCCVLAWTTSKQTLKMILSSSSCVLCLPEQRPFNVPLFGWGSSTAIGESTPSDRNRTCHVHLLKPFTSDHIILFQHSYVEGNERHLSMLIPRPLPPAGPVRESRLVCPGLPKQP